jgi:hypothetical protein
MGASHPRYSEMIYPLDYGSLEDTTSSDGGGIDMWLGSLNTVTKNISAKTLTGILCTFDTLTKYRTDNHVAAQLAINSIHLETDCRSGKRDAEVKLLIECTHKDVQVIRDFHREMYTLYIPSPMVDNDLSH